MFKTEIICETCDKHYVIVISEENEDPTYCPFCSTKLELDQEDNNESWD